MLMAFTMESYRLRAVFLRGNSPLDCFPHPLGAGRNFTMTVRAVFTDGTVKDFPDCDEFQVNKAYQCFFIQHKEHLIMLPVVNVKYIGYKEDVE